MAITSINREVGFEYERRGRVVDQRQQAARLEQRARDLLRVPTSRKGRSGGVGATTGGARSKETVLKVIGWSKARASATSQGRYISRTRDSDVVAGVEPIALENERGELIDGSEAIKAEYRAWGLKADHENRSRKWREASPPERQAMDQVDALQRRQSAHIMFSLPKGSLQDPEILRSVTREAAQATFGAAGFRYTFAIHTDHSERPHAHLIVKARSEPIESSGTRSRSLRLGPKELDQLRQVFTQHAQDHGLDVAATRRIDRPELRNQILQGEEPLRKNLKASQYSRKEPQPQKQSTGAPDQGSVFETKAPVWYAQHGASYERRRLTAFDLDHADDRSPAATRERAGLMRRLTAALGLAREAPTSPDLPDRAQSPTLKRIDAHFERTVADSAGGRESFIQMYREAPRLAVWAANNHPLAFGSPTGVKPSTRLTGRGMGVVLTPAEKVTPIMPVSVGRPIEADRDLPDRVAAAKARHHQERDRQEVPKQLRDLAATAETRLPADVGRELAKQLRELAATPPPLASDAAKLEKYRELDARLQQRDRAARQRDGQTRDRGRKGPDR